MFEAWLSKLIARYGVLPLATVGSVLLIVLLFGSIAGIAKIRAGWYEHKADKLDVRARQAERAALIAKADTKQVELSVDIAAKATSKQDQLAAGQRQNTAKAVEVIHERIVEVPIAVLPATDPVVLWQVHQARDRAQAAANRVSGKKSH